LELMEYKSPTQGVQKRLSTLDTYNVQEYDFRQAFSKGIEIVIG